MVILAYVGTVAPVGAGDPVGTTYTFQAAPPLAFQPRVAPMVVIAVAVNAVGGKQAGVVQLKLVEYKGTVVLGAPDPAILVNNV